MKRLVILALGMGLLVTACAGHGAVSLGKVPSPAGSHSPAPKPSKSHPSPSPTPVGTQTPTPPPSPRGTVTYQLWFAMGEKLFETKRTEPATLGVGTAAMKALLQGPTAAERAAGVATIIPSGTALNGLSISNGVATVDLTTVYASGGGSLSEQFRLAQVVYTLTQFSTVKGVNFRLDGKPVKVFSGSSSNLKVATREDALMVEALLAAEVVDAVHSRGDATGFGPRAATAVSCVADYPSQGAIGT